MPERTDIENSSEFRASIIPYDTFENPNAPILASSGDDINLIFSIPKESFRNLAIAAIAHLGSNSDFEQAGMSNGIKESDNNKRKRSSETNFRLSDVVDNLESENTKDIIDAYTEDSKVSENVTNKHKYSENQKSHVNGVSNGSLEVGDTAPNGGYEDENHTKNIENESNHANVPYDHNRDLSDCPELKSAWPVIHPFTETEKIPIEEMKSLVLNGFITKYLKIEISNEFVMIKVTSESSVLVDAVKYKETVNLSARETESSEDAIAGNENKDLSGNKSQYFVIDADISQPLQTTGSNTNGDSTVETDSLVDENESDKLINEDISCISDTIHEIPVDQHSASNMPEPENNLKLEMEATTENAESLLQISSNSSETTNDSSESNSADETIEIDSADEYVANAKCEETLLKKEMEKFNINIESSSPTERLKISLRECLKISLSEIKAKQTEESVISNPQISSENPDSKENSSENVNLEIKAKCLDDSLDESVSEPLEMADSNEEIIERHETERSDKESNAECESPKPGPEDDSMPLKKEPIHKSPNKDESMIVKEDSTTVENNSVLNDSNFTIESSRYVEETNIEKESFDKPTEEKNALKDSALGRDLHFSENDVINDCRNLDEVECNIDRSHDIMESTLCEHEENENMETNDNEMQNENCTLQNHHEEQCEEAVVENNCCDVDIVTESSKLENFNNSLAEDTIADGKEITENILIDDKTEAENNYETNNERLESDELIDVKGKTKKSPKIIVDKNVKDTLNEEYKHDDSGEALSENLKKESLEPSSEYLENFVSETAGIEERQPESSFASYVDSFIDTAADANVESASECGDVESDDVKSVASESDDSKDSGKQVSIRRNRFKKNKGVDEVDCAPTRTRRKAISGLSKDAIPENAEIKSTKLTSLHTSTLDSPLKYSGRTSPTARSLRSKSLEPTPQTSKGSNDKKHSTTVASEETTRRTRAKTPDVIGKKDIKTTARSSPRKLPRSATAGEPSSTSKVQNKTNADSKSRTNPDSMSTKRSKRSSKE